MMAFLSENPVWEEGIRRIEATDPVLGGDVVNPDTMQGGAANIANLQAANRLAFLKNVLDGRYTNEQVDAAIAAAVGVLTAAEILTRVKTVDGAGSGLDADLLDGLHASAFWKVADSALSASDNGYQLLPSGLIVQWGTTSASPHSFPIAFPTSPPFSVIITDRGSQTPTVFNVASVTKTAFGFTSSLDPPTGYWIAIGH